MIHIYDMEVMADDWVLVTSPVDKPNSFTVIHNNPERLQSFMASIPDLILGGFNNKHYDDWILLSILNGNQPRRVKALSDYIIGGGAPWAHPSVEFQKKPFSSFDLRDDVADPGLSLKAIEGNLKLPIVESSVSFDIDRELTKKELAETIRYCKNDVLATHKLYQVRKDYIDNKLVVGRMFGVPDQEAMSMTNAKLSAVVLGATRQERDDERDYKIPDCLDKDLIPEPIMNFFMQIRDASIPDAVLFGADGTKGKTLSINFETSSGICPVTYAWGGVHGGKPAYHYRSTPDRYIVNYDVSSLYPNSMINFGYCSRSMKNPKAYEDIVETRIKAKKAGDKVTAGALKLVVNTVYGAMLTKFNDLMDKWAGRSVCISNQLAMTQLIVMLSKACHSIDFVNINTDGVMFLIDKDEDQIAADEVEKWCETTRFEMERDDFEEVWQKDVNNYIGLLKGGKLKTKGGFVSLYEGGTFKSNSESIIDKAVVDYLTKGIPVEETIEKEEDIFRFQRIEKTGGTYEGSYQYRDGKKVKLQKVNRIYAVKDESLGKIVKGKWITEKRKKNKETGLMDSVPFDPPLWQETTIPDCPPHAGIDNENILTKSDLDLEYYINRAKARVDKYINLDKTVEKKLKTIKEVVKIMAVAKKVEATEVIDWTTATLGRKLIEARKRFSEANVQKTGINRYAEFKYFTLDDIVPVKLRIFSELGLVDVIEFDTERQEAVLSLYNADAVQGETQEVFRFTSPMGKDESLIKNPIQKVGAVQTYVRRYLNLALLDVVEGDTIDSTSGKEETKAKRPATPEKRDEIKKELINESGAAADTQIKAIKTGLKKLKTKSIEKYEDYIKATVAKLKGGLTKEEAEATMKEIGEKLEEE